MMLPQPLALRSRYSPPSSKRESGLDQVGVAEETRYWLRTSLSSSRKKFWVLYSEAAPTYWPDRGRADDDNPRAVWK